MVVLGRTVPQVLSSVANPEKDSLKTVSNIVIAMSRQHEQARTRNFGKSPFRFKRCFSSPLLPSHRVSEDQVERGRKYEKSCPEPARVISISSKFQHIREQNVISHCHEDSSAIFAKGTNRKQHRNDRSTPRTFYGNINARRYHSDTSDRHFDRNRNDERKNEKGFTRPQEFSSYYDRAQSSVFVESSPDEDKDVNTLDVPSPCFLDFPANSKVKQLQDNESSYYVEYTLNESSEHEISVGGEDVQIITNGGEVLDSTLSEPAENTCYLEYTMSPSITGDDQTSIHGDDQTSIHDDDQTSIHGANSCYLEYSLDESDQSTFDHTRASDDEASCYIDYTLETSPQQATTTDNTTTSYLQTSSTFRQETTVSVDKSCVHCLHNLMNSAKFQDCQVISW